MDPVKWRLSKIDRPRSITTSSGRLAVFMPLTKPLMINWPLARGNSAGHAARVAGCCGASCAAGQGLADPSSSCGSTTASRVPQPRLLDDHQLNSPSLNEHVRLFRSSSSIACNLHCRCYTYLLGPLSTPSVTCHLDFPPSAGLPSPALIQPFT